MRRKEKVRNERKLVKEQENDQVEARERSVKNKKKNSRLRKSKMQSNRENGQENGNGERTRVENL